MSLLVVGTVAFDSIKTPRGQVDRVIGGAATYIAWAASFYTRKIMISSIVGEDFPESELKLMADKGINTDGIEIVKGGKSFFWEGEYHDDMNTRDTLATELNVLADFDPKLPSSYMNPEYVMLGNLTPSVQASVIDQLEKQPKLIVMDTMNFWMDTALDELLELIPRVDILTINDEEARQLSGEYSLKKAARKIIQMGLKYLIIKKGEHGALLFNEDGKMFFAPALPLNEVKDPTGAGDTFAGGFIGYLAETKDHSFENVKRAVIYGSAMASFNVEDYSLDRLRTLNHGDIAERLDQFINLVRFDSQSFY